jgi:syntaxin 5
MEMSLVQQVVPRHEEYAQNRASALHNVESTITELSGIFTHLATMVAHQGELAIRFFHFFLKYLTIQIVAVHCFFFFPLLLYVKLYVRITIFVHMF